MKYKKQYKQAFRAVMLTKDKKYFYSEKLEFSILRWI
jgi:hypothetical protein